MAVHPRMALREGADHAMNWAQDLGSRTTSYLQEQPLLLGALGVTLGAALGMLLPSSRYEREMLGGVREGLRDTAAEAVRDVRDRAVRVAETVVDPAQDATRGKDLSDPAPTYVAAAARGPVADTTSRVGDAVAETTTNGGAAAEHEGVGPDAQERAPAPRH
jgi:hypothetical protein